MSCSFSVSRDSIRIRLWPYPTHPNMMETCPIPIVNGTFSVPRAVAVVKYCYHATVLCDWETNNLYQTKTALLEVFKKSENITTVVFVNITKRINGAALGFVMELIASTTSVSKFKFSSVGRNDTMTDFIYSVIFANRFTTRWSISCEYGECSFYTNFLNALATKSTIQTLAIRNMRDDTQTNSAVMTQLVTNNTALRKFTLDTCLITTPRIDDILAALSRNKVLETLRIINVLWKLPTEGPIPLAPLVSMIENSRTLIHLDISKNSINAKRFAEILIALASNKSLQYVNLLKCCTPIQFMSHLPRTIRKNHTIQQLLVLEGNANAVIYSVKMLRALHLNGSLIRLHSPNDTAVVPDTLARNKRNAYMRKISLGDLIVLDRKARSSTRLKPLPGYPYKSQS